jgi:hypothetical protein
MQQHNGDKMKYKQTRIKQHKPRYVGNLGLPEFVYSWNL